MANKNDRMMVAYYANEGAAKKAAAELQQWDKANADVKLGAIAVVTLDPKTGKLDAKAVGERRTKSGTLWGTAVGAAAGLVTGGLALIPAMLLGAGGGSAVGAMSHKKVGMSDADREQMTANLRAGGAALIVMADIYEVNATKAELARNGGKVEAYEMPAETAAAITEAAEAQTEAAAAVDAAVADALPELAPEGTEAQTVAAAAVAAAAVAALPEGTEAQTEAAAAEAAAVEAEAEETAETEREVATEMPELAPEGAEAVAKIVLATNLPSEDAAKLHAAGVEKASDLLGLAATPQGRKELADATGLSNATILAGVKKMDLMRMRGVGVKHGALLLAAGVDTVPELAQRNPKNLHAALANVNAEKQLVMDLPTEAEVAGWVEAAKAAPRIISY
jgi:uncharacterized membrane protein